LISNMKETWAYYNSQIVSQTRYFSQLKMKRMSDQLSTYIKNFNNSTNKSFGLFIELTTKLMTLGLTKM
jgi:hypothetical protein